MNGASGAEVELLEAVTSSGKSTAYANSYRCIPVLNDLLKQPSVVDHVYYSRRHIALVYKDECSLVVFDNVPQWAHPEKLDIPSLIQTLLSDSPSPPHVLSLRYSSKIVHLSVDSENQKETLLVIHEDGEMSSWEWIRESWKWISSGFAQLRLPPRVIESSVPRKISCPLVTPGRRIYWMEAIIEDESASGDLKTDPKALGQALFCTEYRFIESPALRAKDPKSQVLQLEVSTASTMLAVWRSKVQELRQAPRDGLWITFEPSSPASKPSLNFFSMITNKTSPVTLPIHHLQSTHHPITLEIVSLSSSGQLSLVRPLTESEVSVTAFSALKLPEDSSIINVSLHQQLIATCTSERWDIFDIRSGSLLWTLSLHQQHKDVKQWLHLTNRDTPLGFWTSDGLWRVKSIPISQQAQLLASQPASNPSRTTKPSNIEDLEEESIIRPITPQMSAALLSKDWGLDRIETKHLLDILIAYTGLEYPTMQETANFVMACDRLVPHLQSPILLISILESTNLSTYACKITRQFIDACMARHSSGMAATIISQNEVDLKAYRLFTTFNTDTIHLLRKFVELASPSEDHWLNSSQSTESDETAALQSQLLGLSLAECAKMDLDHFQVYMNRCSETLLLKLEEYGGLPYEKLAAASKLIEDSLSSDELHIQVPFNNHAPFSSSVHPNTSPAASTHINPILLREEERPTQPDIFDALCLLYYNYKPHWILPLVDTLIQREGFNEGRSLLPIRALAALPSFEIKYENTSGGSPGSNEQRTEEQKMEEFRVLARVGLLERANRAASGQEVLLRLYQVTHKETYWKMILYAIDSRKSMSHAQKSRTELLTSLLMRCLEPSNRMASNRFFEDIWSRFSSNLAPMDLTTSLRQEFARIQPRQRVPVLVVEESEQMSVGTLRDQLLRLGVK